MLAERQWVEWSGRNPCWSGPDGHIEKMLSLIRRQRVPTRARVGCQPRFTWLTCPSLGGTGKPAHFTVIYTGAHGPANSLETVLEAASLLTSHAEIRFVLVGDGPSKASLVEKADKLKLSNFRFLDPVPKEQIPILLASADAALITLRAVDAFAYAISPNKLFDYMAAGKPVLSAVPGDIARLVEDTRTGVAIEPEKPKALADAIVRLYQTPVEERMAMGRRGQMLIQERYSREQLAKKLLAIL